MLFGLKIGYPFISFFDVYLNELSKVRVFNYFDDLYPYSNYFKELFIVFSYDGLKTASGFGLYLNSYIVSSPHKKFLNGYCFSYIPLIPFSSFKKTAYFLNRSYKSDCFVSVNRQLFYPVSCDYRSYFPVPFAFILGSTFLVSYNRVVVDVENQKVYLGFHFYGDGGKSYIVYYDEFDNVLFNFSFYLSDLVPPFKTDFILPSGLNVFYRFSNLGNIYYLSFGCYKTITALLEVDFYFNPYFFFISHYSGFNNGLSPVAIGSFNGSKITFNIGFAFDFILPYLLKVFDYPFYCDGCCPSNRSYYVLNKIKGVLGG